MKRWAALPRLYLIEIPVCEEPMPHLCPQCHAPIGRFRNRICVRHSRRPGLAWYRYSAARYFCPNCDVELRRVVQPAGYAVYTLMTIASGVYILFLFLHPSVLLRKGFSATAGLLALNYALSAAYIKWGYGYSVAAQESALDDAAF